MLYFFSIFEFIYDHRVWRYRTMASACVTLSFTHEISRDIRDVCNVLSCLASIVLSGWPTPQNRLVSNVRCRSNDTTCVISSS